MNKYNDRINASSEASLLLINIEILCQYQLNDDDIILTTEKDRHTIRNNRDIVIAIID